MASLALSRRWQLGIAGAAVVSGLALLAVWKWSPRRDEPPLDDPRLTYATPFRNVRPEVKYVGDGVCASCHVDHAATYREHPMGRSFAGVPGEPDPDRYDRDAGNPFERFGLHFEIERRGERVVSGGPLAMVHSEQIFHKQVRYDKQGKVVCASEDAIYLAIGSGRHGRSYLYSRDECLFQSTISWYTQAGSWDLSPGADRNYLFGRPIAAKCLYCHCNDAKPVPHTLNRYRAGFGGSIGCERCHGPGELHVREREAGVVLNGVDDTIVNPKHLDPALREAVCQQCHLQGVQRIVRRNRDTFDYRPGLPLHLFWSVFVKPEEMSDDQKAVGQVEQMYASRCFQASAGKMGCASCHDPHALPAEEKRVAYHRDRCLKCHERAGCKLPIAARREKEAEDSCIVCHMPRFQTSDIAHTAVTDHRIRRDTGQNPRARPFLRGSIPVVHFHRDLVDPRDPDLTRDLGIALVEMARQYDSLQKHLGQLALPLLEEAVKRFPDDTPTRGAHGYALLLNGRATEARAALEGVLELADVETTQMDLAAAHAALGDLDAAVRCVRRALAVNTSYPRYHSILAELLAESGKWSEAADECRTVLRFNAADVKTRQLLVTMTCRGGDKERARAEFDTLLALDPPDPDALRKWFDELMR